MAGVSVSLLLTVLLSCWLPPRWRVAWIRWELCGRISKSTMPRKEQVRVKKLQLSGASGCAASFKQETGARFDSDLLRCRGSTPCFVGAQMCWRTPLSWKESFEQGTVPVLRAQEGFGGAGYNALPEGSLCRIRPGQPGSSANLTPTKRGSALRRRSRQDSSQRVIKFQVSPASGHWPSHSRKKLGEALGVSAPCRRPSPPKADLGEPIWARTQGCGVAKALGARDQASFILARPRFGYRLTVSFGAQLSAIATDTWSGQSLHQESDNRNKGVCRSQSPPAKNHQWCW